MWLLLHCNLRVSIIIVIVENTKTFLLQSKNKAITMQPIWICIKKKLKHNILDTSAPPCSIKQLTNSMFQSQYKHLRNEWVKIMWYTQHTRIKTHTMEFYGALRSQLHHLQKHRWTSGHYIQWNGPDTKILIPSVLTHLENINKPNQNQTNKQAKNNNKKKTKTGKRCWLPRTRTGHNIGWILVQDRKF